MSEKYIVEVNAKHGDHLIENGLWHVRLGWKSGLEHRGRRMMLSAVEVWIKHSCIASKTPDFCVHEMVISLDEQLDRVVSAFALGVGNCRIHFRYFQVEILSTMAGLSQTTRSKTEC